MNMPTSPSAPDSSWTTPAASVPPVVGNLPREQAVAGVSPVAFPGDADPGGRDTVASSVAEAVAGTEARYHELAGDTYGAGSQIGDVLSLPQVPAGPGVGLADVDLPAQGLGY